MNTNTRRKVYTFPQNRQVGGLIEIGVVDRIKELERQIEYWIKLVIRMGPKRLWVKNSIGMTGAEERKLREREEG